MIELPNLQNFGFAEASLQPFESSVACSPVCELNDRFALKTVPLNRRTRSEFHPKEIVGNSEALLRVLEDIETVASTDSTVLISGETGTGKELIARAVHNLSPRKSRAFVKFNCAAFPTGLLESELFGHEKGAFTGAIAQRWGDSNLPMAEPYFSMKLARFRWNCSQSFYAFCRSANSSAWAVREPFTRMPG